MVIHDFHVPGSIVAPDEADPELVVDPNAPLTAAIAGQLFKSVAWRYPQSLDSGGRIEHLQLANCDRLDVGESRYAHAVEQTGGIPALERPDHGKILTSRVSNVNGEAPLRGFLSLVLRLPHLNRGQVQTKFLSPYTWSSPLQRRPVLMGAHGGGEERPNFNPQSSLEKVPCRVRVKSSGPGRPAARLTIPGRHRTNSVARSLPPISLPVTTKPRSLDRS